MKILFALALVFLTSCANDPAKTQDVYTDDDNYFDYQYYDSDFSPLNTFEDPYDYFYYEEVQPPVRLREVEKDSDDWFFEDY